jgi:hypothetical protein
MQQGINKTTRLKVLGFIADIGLASLGFGGDKL